MGKIGVIQEQGDYGLGFNPLNENEQKKAKDTYYANKDKSVTEYAKQKQASNMSRIFTQVKSK